MRGERALPGDTGLGREAVFPAAVLLQRAVARLAWLLVVGAGLTACKQSTPGGDPAVADAATGDTAAADMDSAADGATPDSTGADAESTDAAGTDAAGTETAGADAAGTDAAVGDVSAADAGADALDAGADCAVILAQIGALKPQLAACKSSSQCQTFEYPICGSMGCFQTPVAKDSAALSQLQSLAEQALQAQCPDFHCGCGPYAPTYCLGGQCRSCPPDCDGSCDDWKDALVQAVHSADACSADADCVGVSTGLCPVGDLPCGGFYVNTYAPQENLQAAVTAYSQACGASTCKCAFFQKAACVKGHCVVASP